MAKYEELLAHAARCIRLAQSCSDRAVAEKLRQLAHDYFELAGQPAVQNMLYAEASQHDGFKFVVPLKAS